MWSSSLAVTIAITTIFLIVSVATPKWVTVSDFMPNSAFAIQFGLLNSCMAQPWVTVCGTYESTGGSDHDNTRTTAAALMVMAIISHCGALCSAVLMAVGKKQRTIFTVVVGSLAASTLLQILGIAFGAAFKHALHFENSQYGYSFALAIVSLLFSVGTLGFVIHRRATFTAHMTP
ncbi:hypothetical protein BDZ88DRAFT_62552 [Geranomyces variabilis]|nr:hypothetical protein BDZ88DRAFT_62552 [Geranomyces variabilis]KAJ3138270.1 hypothetical protein HDU90_001232 [Geranomyces variabilis]